MREAFEGACDRQKKRPVTMPDVGVDGKVTIVNHNHNNDDDHDHLDDGDHNNKDDDDDDDDQGGGNEV